jgi:negative modulator of initiation of replication
MRQIEIDEEIYDHLRLSNRPGETLSDTLKRLLKHIPADSQMWQDHPDFIEANKLQELINNREFRAQRNAKDRFLFILSYLYRKDPERFKLVLEYKGTKRRYFGTSKDDLEVPGKTVSARKIPGSEYWVVTNSSTSFKGDILRNVLMIMDYGGRTGEKIRRLFLESF